LQILQLAPFGWRGVISEFGGFKQSGLGREGGFDGIHEFLETKYIGVTI
jgi:succinate-semialdehyde dehydrogenase / glutarate-semialdehyde dehydrogenase